MTEAEAREKAEEVLRDIHSPDDRCDGYCVGNIRIISDAILDGLSAGRKEVASKCGPTFHTCACGSISIGAVKGEGNERQI